MVCLRRQLMAAICLLQLGCSEAKQTIFGPAPPMETVRRFCGKDLCVVEKDALQSLQDAVEKIRSGIASERVGRDFEPRFIWEYKATSEEAGCLVLECEPPTVENETTSIRLVWLDHAGNVRTEAEFATGHHCYLTDASLRSVEGFSFPVIVLKVDCRQAAGLDYSRQYYAPIENRFDLIRLEGRDAQAHRNLYYATHLACGPPPVEQSAEQWETDLCSMDRARVLRSLVWLAGDQSVGAVSEHRGHSIGDPAQTILAEKVRERPAVIQRVLELAHSDKAWEQEAARLVSR
jgi:hypothetical protein